MENKKGLKIREFIKNRGYFPIVFFLALFLCLTCCAYVENSMEGEKNGVNPEIFHKNQTDRVGRKQNKGIWQKVVKRKTNWLSLQNFLHKS